MRSSGSARRYEYLHKLNFLGLVGLSFLPMILFCYFSITFIITQALFFYSARECISKCISLGEGK